MRRRRSSTPRSDWLDGEDLPVTERIAAHAALGLDAEVGRRPAGRPADVAALGLAVLGRHFDTLPTLVVRMQHRVAVRQVDQLALEAGRHLRHERVALARPLLTTWNGLPTSPDFVVGHGRILLLLR